MLEGINYIHEKFHINPNILNILKKQTLATFAEMKRKKIANTKEFLPQL